MTQISADPGAGAETREPSCNPPGARPVMSASTFLEGRVHHAVGVLADAAREWQSTADPEALHRYRVALRRLRTMLRVAQHTLPMAGAPQVADALRRAARATGPVRDWDILLSGPLAELAIHVPRPGLRALVRHVQARRAEARQRCLRMLEAPGLARQLERLGQPLVSGPRRNSDGVAAFARKRLRSGHARLAKQRKRLPAMKPAELHRLRIRAKRVRYTAELFAERFDAPAVEAYLAGLRHLQDTLGALQDAATCKRLAADRALQAVDPRAGALLLGWCAARALPRSDVLESLQRRPKLRPFW